MKKSFSGVKHIGRNLHNKRMNAWIGSEWKNGVIYQGRLSLRNIYIYAKFGQARRCFNTRIEDQYNWTNEPTKSDTRSRGERSFCEF